MAVSGVILMGFVLAHMIGNLKMYLGPAELDRYGEFLRELLVPLLPRTVTLWLIRSVLILAFAVHIHAAYTLTMMNRRARPVRYQSPRDYIAANFASRTMRWTGVIVLAFLAFHLADFTWGVKGIRGGGDSWHRARPTRTSWPASTGRWWRSSTSWPTWRWAFTCGTADGACFRASA